MALFEREDAKRASTGTVFIVDDDVDLRRAVSLLAGSVGLAVEAHSSAQEFLDKYDPQRPGCLVLDVRIPGISGLELQRTLASQKFPIPIIFLSAHGEIPMATQAIRAGAIDFLQKPFSPHALLERIHEALALDEDNRRKRAEAGDVKSRLLSLTQREQEIMWLLAAGESAKHIAVTLSISSKTVDNHRAKILEKMEVENPTQLAHLLSLMD